MTEASGELWAIGAGLSARRVAFVVATITDTGGSTPRLAGARMLVSAESCWGTVGGGAFEHRVIAEARDLLTGSGPPHRTLQVHLVRDLGMCCGGRMTAFLQKEAPPPRLWIFGAGHVGTALGAVVAGLDFAVTVVDGRAEWAAAARFPPTVTVRDEEPEDLVRAGGPEAGDYAVVLTHDHPLDEALIRALAPRGLAYLGLIGSRAKWARFRQRLSARGLDEACLDAVRCPVGLSLGGSTPAEIAVSIAAELVAARHRAPGESAGPALSGQPSAISPRNSGCS